MDIQPGDYVLATKYSDGDPKDQWVVGLYSHYDGDRHYVVDGHGLTLRPSGFRRVQKISDKRGKWLLQHRRGIEFSGKSLWSLVRVGMNPKKTE